MKIRSKKNFIRSLSILISIIFIILIFSNKSSFSYNKKIISIYINKGDTLWSIAINLQKTDYYKGKDIRYIIDDIKNINNLKNSNLVVGEKLDIPTT